MYILLFISRDGDAVYNGRSNNNIMSAAEYYWADSRKYSWPCSRYIKKFIGRCTVKELGKKNVCVTAQQVLITNASPQRN
jgi:hypothetical protein